MTHLPPELHAAYEMFRQELKQHLEALKAEAAAPNNEDFEPQRRKIEHRFHLIRGGAGFFQLPEVAEICATGERLFRAATARESFDAAMPQFRDLLKQLSLLEAQINCIA